ncbi:hypothetical protein QQF64_007399 [Cirrhinus molitorella]|uniref:Uncharacterized protein n=2 Tax=Cirrhinus molitorella TaxID=172907 RepID=A0AA88PU15_9TELE|nr:hypothetical protein Q8A67_013830 [Cirrhinus molitorella]
MTPCIDQSKDNQNARNKSAPQIKPVNSWLNGGRGVGMDNTSLLISTCCHLVMHDGLKLDADPNSPGSLEAAVH